jgi:hypothetical protein
MELDKSFSPHRNYDILAFDNFALA